MSSIPDSIGELIQLKTLTLHDIQYLNIPPSFKNLSNLETLEIVGMSNPDDINEFPENLQLLPTIQNLTISMFYLPSISSSIGEFDSLKSLDLSGNMIDELPLEIGNLQNLRSLILFDNRLDELPKSIGNLTGLEKLNLGNNNLDTLPLSIMNLKNLQCLNMRGNGPMILDSKFLKYFDMIKNNGAEVVLSEQTEFCSEITAHFKLNSQITHSC